MDEIGKALADLVKGATHLAPMVASAWFWVRIVDAVIGWLECITIMGALYGITRAVLTYFRWYVERVNR